MALIWLAIGAAVAWFVSSRTRDVRATVDVLDEEITVGLKPTTREYDPDAVLPLGGGLR